MLKKVLSLLLSKFYSKKESALVGHQAMPSRSIVALNSAKTSIDNWGAVFEGVAPSDGFAAITVTASSDFCIISANSYEIQVFSTPKVTGDVVRAVCPVSKGTAFLLSARNAKNITCEFIKTIGGGYQTLKKIILQGGCLCLNSLLASLRRSSFLTRRSGYANNPFLVRRLSLRSLGMEPATKILCLQETGLYALPLRVALGQECFRKQIYRDVCCKTTTENTRRLLFKLVKEKLSTSILQVLKQRLLVFGLFPQLVANRFVLGGAL